LTPDLKSQTAVFQSRGVLRRELVEKLQEGKVAADCRDGDVALLQDADIIAPSTFELNDAAMKVNVVPAQIIAHYVDTTRLAAALNTSAPPVIAVRPHVETA
jgi:hypothetical protein